MRERECVWMWVGVLKREKDSACVRVGKSAYER
jgi:hypothetical protein